MPFLQCSSLPVDSLVSGNKELLCFVALLLCSINSTFSFIPSLLLSPSLLTHFPLFRLPFHKLTDSIPVSDKLSSFAAEKQVCLLLSSLTPSFLLTTASVCLVFTPHFRILPEVSIGWRKTKRQRWLSRSCSRFLELIH